MLSNLYFCIRSNTLVNEVTALFWRCDLLSNLYFCIRSNTIWTREILRHFCCDLLSNLYFCIRSNTYLNFISLGFAVVICFQICIFVLGQTPASCSGCKPTGCDLLSNLYFCIRSNTYKHKRTKDGLVVICFQICIFVLGQTPTYRLPVSLKLL